MDNIYLDNAATTPVDSRVLDAMIPYYKEEFGNASSVHKFGREAKVLLEDARDTIADFIGARSSEVYFTSGGTEADNFAVKGIAISHFGRKKHIISSKLEHSAVLDSLEYLRTRFGFEVTYVKNDKNGLIDLDELRDSITDETFLLCIMHSNNELGVINDIPKIAEIAKEKNVLVHSDTVQSLGKAFFKITDLNCSTAAFSAHKIYGPKGIGALYIKSGTPIDKLSHGGKQERDRRGGTENIAAIAGFKKAVELLKDEMDNDIAHYKKLKEKLIYAIKESFGSKVIINSLTENSPLERGVPKGRGVCLDNIVNISFDTSKIKIDADTLLIKLDMKGIAVSSGSACTSGSVQPSHVIKALGYNDDIAKSSLRISFGRFNKESDVDYLIITLKEIIRN
ncbi:MAG TPA: cysteine desulfurase family protein [Ignavibacteria bacterium]